MATEAKYVVTAAAGISIGAGRFAAGEHVYHSWLDGQEVSLVRWGMISHTGTSGEVPEVEMVGDPYWYDPITAPTGDTADVQAAPAPQTEAELAHALAASATAPTFDPGVDLTRFVRDLSIPEVLAHVEAHPETLSDVVAAERLGKDRPSLLRQLEALVAEQAATAAVEPVEGETEETT